MLLVPQALGSHGIAPRTDETLGTYVEAGPARTDLDPGASLGALNPRLLLPGTTKVQARATVVDAMGAPVAGATVAGAIHWRSSGTSVALEFAATAPGVHHSAPVEYAGGIADLVVSYDFTSDGSVDHVAIRVYRPALE